MTRYPIVIQVQDPDTEDWSDLFFQHVLRVNRAGGGEGFGAGADQFHQRLSFELRWNRKLEAAVLSPQIHRLVYRGRTFNIIDYDDYMEQHRKVKVVGEAYE